MEIESVNLNRKVLHYFAMSLIINKDLRIVRPRDYKGVERWKERASSNG